MIYPNVSLEEWTAKTSLPVKEYDCPHCNKKYRTTVPVITKDCYGLETPLHECGPNFISVILTPRTPESIQFWQNVVGTVGLVDRMDNPIPSGPTFVLEDYTA